MSILGDAFPSGATLLVSERPHDSMDAVFLVASGRLVMPRLARIVATEGSGLTVLRADGALAGEWRASVGNAVEAARRLAKRPRADVEIRVPGATALTGASAGLPIGLVTLGALLGEPVPRHFASGGVVDARGTLSGGAAAHRKGEAAAEIARSNGWGDDVLFVLPPVEPPRIAGVRVVSAADLGTAYAGLLGASRSITPSADSSSTSAAASRASSTGATSG